MVTHEVYITLTSSILLFVVLRYCFELRRRFAVSFRRCFENFDFTSKLDGGSPSHFDTVSTFIHSRYCFDLRRWFAVSFRLYFENSISLRNSKAVHHRISTLFRLSSIVDNASNCEGDSPSLSPLFQLLKIFVIASKFAFVATSQCELITKFTNMKYPHAGEELSSS